MKAPINWLNDFVEIIDIDPKIIAHEATMTGTKAEGVIVQAQDIKNVVTGKILDIKKHPDADKLVVCNVDVKESVNQIVTGADNISVNDIVPVALPGAVLANNLKIKSGKLRGINSDGMLCSIQELGFSVEDYPDAHPDGIYILPPETKVGEDIKKSLGLNAPIIDFEITSNRPDCLCIEGLAREIAITMNLQFKLKTSKVNGNKENSVNEILKVSIKDANLCRRYVARAVKNVKIQRSPKWMEDRLRQAGVRPINNIVDITNYVMLEFGQPMHAFDYDLLGDNQIIVRRATISEEFTALDESSHKLDDSMLVISNSKHPVALAGIMGGENSQINDNTKTIIFESANFNGINVRLTAKKLGMRTESSSRFEKGLDPENAMRAMDRACELIELLKAGEVSFDVIDVYPTKIKSAHILFRPDKINNFLGTNIPDDKMLKILSSTGCEIIEIENKKYIKAPTFRADIEEEVDLAEEVARFYGYNNIKPTLLSGKSTTLGGLNHYQQQIIDISSILRSRGYFEASTYSFLGEKSFDKILLGKDNPLRDGVIISNPLGEEFSIMRTTMLPSILEISRINKVRGVNEFKLFEIAKIYVKNNDSKSLPDEREIVAGVFSQSATTDNNGKNFYVVKGEIEEIFNNLGLKIYDFIPEKENVSFHPGRTAKIFSDKKEIGIIGYIHPKVAENYEIDNNTVVFMLDYKTIKEMNFEPKKYVQLPKYPATTRDLAIITSKEVLSKEIEDVIKQKATNLLESVELFDVYQGKQLEDGKKSCAYSLVFRSKDKTLTDNEINPIIESILKELEEKFDAKLR